MDWIKKIFKKEEVKQENQESQENDFLEGYEEIINYDLIKESEDLGFYIEINNIVHPFEQNVIKNKNGEYVFLNLELKVYINALNVRRYHYCKSNRLLYTKNNEILENHREEVLKLNKENKN